MQPVPGKPPAIDIGASDPQPALNPFRSERLRPGVIEFLFDGTKGIDDLLDTLQSNHWRGEIVGPHGTGKSTLARMLLPRLTAIGFDVRLGSFHGGQVRWSQLKADRRLGTSARPATARRGLRTFKTADDSLRQFVVIDGFEQLSALARWRWKWLTRWRGQGLIVTTHRSVGLPALYRTDVTPVLAREVVRRIAGDGLAGFRENEIEAALQSAGGNLRDALFELYDQYEARRTLEAAGRKPSGESPSVH